MNWEESQELTQAIRTAIGHISDQLSVLAASIRENGGVFEAHQVADIITTFAANIEATADETIGKRDQS